MKDSFPSIILNCNRKIFYPLLAVSILLYFAFVRIFQDKLALTNKFVNDTYPGLPVLPEPLEIPLYLFGYIAIPLLAFFLYWIYSILERKELIRLASIAGISGTILAVIALLYLKLPALLNYVQTITTYIKTNSLEHIIWLLTTKRLFVIQLSAALATVVFVLLMLLWKNPTIGWLERFSNARLLKKIAPLLLILLAFLVLTPEFSYQEGHYNYVIGTVNDILHGKPFLYESTNQYGILNVYLFTAFFQYITPLGYPVTAFLLSILFFLFFLGVYFFLKWFLNSRLWALIGTFASLTLYFFTQSSPYMGATYYPGPSPYRQGFYILVALLLAAYAKWKKPILKEVALLVAATAFFWNLDSGAYVIIAICAAFSYEILVSTLPWKQKLLKLGWLGVRLLIYLLGIFALINGVNFIVFGSFPQWSLLLDAITFYESGFGKLPLPLVGIFELYVLIYLLGLVWIALHLRSRRAVPLPFIFILIYGIFSFNYYVGNSAWSYLYPVTTPAIAVVLFFYRQMLKQTGAHAFWGRVLKISFYALLVFVVVLFLFKLPMDLKKRDYFSIQERLTEIPSQDRELYEDARYLQKQFPELARIPVFHLRLGKLLIYADKTNEFQMVDSYDVVFRSHVTKLIKEIREKKPPVVILGKERDERIDDIEQGITDLYQKQKTLHTLDLYFLIPNFNTDTIPPAYQKY